MRHTMAGRDDWWVGKHVLNILARPMTVLPPSLDPVAAQRWAALADSASPWLHEEVGARMAGRLQWITRQPTSWLHWQPLRGGLRAHAQVAAQYPNSECFVAPAQELTAQAAIKNIVKQPAWWAFKRGPRLHFDPPPHPVQMLWANMALHMAADPQALIGQWHQLLAVDGFVMFSCLGPDSLRELSAVYQALGWPPPSHAFTDMHDWGDMLVQAGFAEPVMDMERITLTWGSAAQLLAELRTLGRNLHRARFAGLRGRGWKPLLEQALTSQLADADQNGRLSLTFEIVYGHAFKPVPRVKLSANSAVSMQDMRAMLQANKGKE
jgi:malonyl-CoA O-methyltransferase